MPFVEGYGIIIDGMHDDGAHAGDFRGRGTAAERIGKEVRAETDALEGDVHRKPGNEKQWDLVGHSATQPRGGQRGALLHGRGDGVVAYDLVRLVGVTHNIGAGRRALAGKGTLGEPMVERGVLSIVERIDTMVGVQSLRWSDTARGHDNDRCVRSPTPERLALHKLFEGRRRHGRRIEHREELLVALGIKEESSLIEDSRFGFSPRAGEHELGQFLPAQRSGTGEQRLELCGSPDLNDVILARGGASVRTSLCHISKLLGAIWRFATTLSIHSRSYRHRCLRARLIAVAILAAAPSAHAQSAGPANAVPKQGYWWYEAPKAQAEPEPEALVKPVIPPMAELATWTPPKIRKLIEEQRDYAATVLTVEAVADFWRLQDFARRKARAFAGVTQLAMLQHPELNSKSANPMVGDARSELAAQKDVIRRSYLRSHAGEFALVMFSRSTCGYCRVQWPIIQRFQEETGWQVTLMDIDKRPEVRERFGVEITPTTMIIRRSSQQRMIIASGVEAYPNLVQMAYQAVRLLRGDIRPEQFMTGPGEDAGFFDALGNGPVSATDPRALGGDLITASGEPQP